MVKYILHLPDDVITFNTERELEDFMWDQICDNCVAGILTDIPVPVVLEMSHSEVIEEILDCECGKDMTAEYTEVW